MATGSSVVVSDEADNFQRLVRLVIKGGNALLKEKFDSIHSPANLATVLKVNKALLTSKKGLMKKQTDILYPSPGKYGTSNDFDITLTSRLLREICGLTPPSTGWHVAPVATDKTVEADLVRIKCYRNEIYHHSAMEIDDGGFSTLWRKVSDTFLRIAKSISMASESYWKQTIKDFEILPLTSSDERHFQELNLWYQYDVDVKKSLQILETASLDNMKGIEGVKNDTKKIAQVLERVNEESGETKNFLERVEKGGEETAQAVGRMENTLTSLDANVNELKDAVGQLQSITTEEHAASQATPNINIRFDVASSVPIPTSNSLVPTAESAMLLQTHENQVKSSYVELMIKIGLHYLDDFSDRHAFKSYMQEIGSIIYGQRIGSLVITVQCQTVQVLERLWDDYTSGHLTEMAEKCLITTKLLDELGFEEIKLKTCISEEEYKKYHEELSFMEHEKVLKLAVSDVGKDSVEAEPATQLEELSTVQPFLQRDSPTANSATGCGNCSAGYPPVVRCVTCCHFLCSFCYQAHLRGNTTRNHKYLFVEDVYKKEKAAVSQLLEETKAKQSGLQDALKGVVEMKTRIKTVGERVAQQVNTSFDSFIQTLEDRRNNLLQQAGEIEQGKLKGLQVQQEELELVLSSVTSSVEFTEKALSDGSQDEVLSMKKQMTDILRELNTGTRPLDLCIDDVICYQVETGSVDDVVNGLGRVSVNRTSPAKCVIKTNVKMEDLKIGKETKMSIFAKDQHGRLRESGGDDVSVEIKSPSARDGTQRIEVTDSGDGSYRASYTPLVPGVHQVFVKINGAHIQKSPFDWNVKDFNSAELSILQMEGLEDGVIYNSLVNQTRIFTFDTSDINGEQFGDDDDEISVQIKEQDSHKRKLTSVQKLGNDRYTFSYKPSSTGNYQVTVKVNGDDIQGSPFTWEVEQWHLKGWHCGSKYLSFSQDNMTVRNISRSDWCSVVGSCGFPAGCHSWKVKVIRGNLYTVGVTDSDVLSTKQSITWYWCDGSKYHLGNGKSSDERQPSNITAFTAGDVCIVFLNLLNKQLTVHHHPSGQTDTWESVDAQNSKLFPYLVLPPACEVSLFL